MTTLAPTPQQQAIMDAAATGRNLIVQARAGTGKTSTLMMLLDAIPAGKSVFIGAFNKAIARELEQRLKDRGVDWCRAQAGTLHSAGFRAWRKAAPGVKVEERKVFDLIKAADLRLTDEDEAAVRKLVSIAKQSGFGALHPVRDAAAWFDLVDHFAIESDLSDELGIDGLISISQSILEASIARDRDVIDFDDMLLAPLVHNVRVFQHDVVCIDEAQDTNATRRALALKMMRRGGQVIAVGDDRQAIYGFSGADSDALELISGALGDALWLPLSRTFRCGKRIVDLAREIVPDYEADDANPDGEVGTVDGIEALTASNLTPDDMILCRLNAPLLSLAYALIRRRVPVRIEGRDIAKGLVALCQRWKARRAEDLLPRLEAWAAREEQRWQAKGRPEKAQPVIDRAETLKIVIENVIDRDSADAPVQAIVAELYSLFGDSTDGSDRRRLPTLSSIHKAKGLEADRVRILTPPKDPRGWAKREWQARQEDNLQYVAITRAKTRLDRLNIQE